MYQYLVAFNYSVVSDVNIITVINKPTSIVLDYPELITCDTNLGTVCQYIEEETGYTDVELLSFSLLG